MSKSKGLQEPRRPMRPIGPKGPKRVDGRRKNRPPEKHRWKPGQSGNPSGRPKGAKSTGKMVMEILDQWISVRVRGKDEKIPFRKGMLLKLADDFMQRGNLKSLAFLLQLYDAAASSLRASDDVSPEDDAILEVLKTMLQSKKSEEDDDA